MLLVCQVKMQQEVGQGMQVSVCVCLCESQVRALFLGLWPITMVDGKKKKLKANYFYTVRTDTETKSEILMYRRLFALSNYSSFTW